MSYRHCFGKRLLILSALLMLSSLSFPLLAQERIECGSEDYRYRHCEIDHRGQVRLIRQLSDSPCVEGKSWGYDRRGVWVDRGCAARFEVVRRGDDYRPGRPDRPSYGRPESGRQETVECRSEDYRYRHCSVDTRGPVRLVDQYSDSPCVEGRTWGHDRRGIWVDRGCAARFEIGRRGGGNDGDRWDDERTATPGWLIGEYRGHSRIFDESIQLSIDRRGQAVARVRGRRIEGYVTQLGQELILGNRRYSVYRQRDGIQTIEKGDRGNIVEYRRIR